MSEGKRAEQPDTDLADAPFLDESERAEAAWLVARENDPGAPAPSPELARAHAELGDLLGDLPTGAPDESWHAEVLRQATAPVETSQPQPQPQPQQTRRIYRWVIVGSFAAAAAIAALILIPRSRPHDGDEPKISIRHGDLVRGDAQEAAVGDQLTVRARPRGASELRVYRDGALVARCPGGPGCRSSADGEHILELRLDAPVQYQVILVIGNTGDLPDQTMSSYLEAARAKHARIHTKQIDVH
jgi:hypothetical protein